MKIILIALFLCVFNAFALMEPVSDAQLVQSAETIIKGTVLSQHCEWNTAKTIIFTFVDVRIDKVYKGDAVAGRTLTLAIPGGSDPDSDLSLYISDQPTFALKENAIFYLASAHGMVDGINYQLFADKANFNGMQRVAYFSQGKHTIQKNSQRTTEQMIFKANENETMDLPFYEELLISEIAKQK